MMKCVLAVISSSTLKSVVFGTRMRFWLLWLFELLYIYLDKLTLTLLSTRIRSLKRALKIVLAQILLAWHE